MALVFALNSRGASRHCPRGDKKGKAAENYHQSARGVCRGVLLKELREVHPLGGRENGEAGAFRGEWGEASGGRCGRPLEPGRVGDSRQGPPGDLAAMRAGVRCQVERWDSLARAWKSRGAARVWPAQMIAGAHLEKRVPEQEGGSCDWSPPECWCWRLCSRGVWQLLSGRPRCAGCPGWSSTDSRLRRTAGTPRRAAAGRERDKGRTRRTRSRGPYRDGGG